MDVGGVPRAWSELDRCLVEADVVISSTSSPDHVITLSLVKAARKARRGRELFLIDIAVPRDVDPAVNDLDGVYLYDVDDLSQIVASSMEGRAAAVEHAEAIVAEASAAFERWTLERSLTPTIVGLRARTRAVLLAELERSLAGKLRHLGAAERTALGAMVDAATNKLLHAPTVRLRGAASDARSADYIEALRELFDLPDVSNASEGEPHGEADGEGDDEGEGEGEGDEEPAAMSGPSAGARAGQARGA
jgi:glutamyl-tRNA reductase